MNKCAIILAAGKGTRMKTELPKCAYPFCGKPMVKYIVENCIKCGINDINVVVGYKKEQIKEEIKEEKVNQKLANEIDALKEIIAIAIPTACIPI